MPVIVIVYQDFSSLDTSSNPCVVNDCRDCFKCHLSDFHVSSKYLPACNIFSVGWTACLVTRLLPSLVVLSITTMMWEDSDESIAVRSMYVKMVKPNTAAAIKEQSDIYPDRRYAR